MERGRRRKCWTNLDGGDLMTVVANVVQIFDIREVVWCRQVYMTGMNRVAGERPAFLKVLSGLQIVWVVFKVCFSLAWLKKNIIKKFKKLK